jgi:hypothetical protein
MWVWSIRLMVVAACAVAILECEGIIRPPFTGNLGLGVLVVLLTIHFLVVVRIARR